MRHLKGTLRNMLLVASLAAMAVVALSWPGESARAAGGQTTVFATFPSATLCTHTTNPPPAQTSIVLIIGAAPRTMCVWTANFKDPQGIAGFEVNFKYDNSKVNVTQVVGSGTWLASTGRDMLIPPCIDPIIGPIPQDPQGLWRADVICTSLGPGPPFKPAGPTGSGLLATYRLQAAATSYTTTSLQDNNIMLFDAGETYDMNGDTDADDIGIDIAIDRALVPHVIQPPGVIGIVVARCADYPAGGFPRDGAVTVGDIYQVVLHFGQTIGHPNWDSMFDLNEDNSVATPDINIAVREFGQTCPVT